MSDASVKSVQQRGGPQADALRENHKTRWKCVCAYDGTTFAGWQSQAGGRSIQDAIESALHRILKENVRIHGSGRTDAGVHARGQVFHFDSAWAHGPGKLVAALRVTLPCTIQVASIRRARPDFHARFGATRKTYSYHICLGDTDPFTRPFCWSIFRPLDVDAMKRAAGLLQGRHDFRSFTALNGPPREDTVRDLRRLTVSARGRQVRIVAEADGFLYRMARSLVGILVKVGEGKLEAAAVTRILQSRERTATVVTAPPQGLCLEKVTYRKGPA